MYKERILRKYLEMGLQNNENNEISAEYRAHE